MIRHTALMSTSTSLYHRHRFPTEIISHCIWLYFPLAEREELYLAARGLIRGGLIWGRLHQKRQDKALN